MTRPRKAPPTPAERKLPLTATPPEDSAKVYDLIHHWVHDGIPFVEACRAAGIQARKARVLLREPKVRARYREELEVLRASERVPSIHALVRLRDTSKSERVQLEAAKTLLADPEGGSARVDISVGVQVAGYVFDLSGGVRDGSPAQPQAIAGTCVDVTPDARSADVPE